MRLYNLIYNSIKGPLNHRIIFMHIPKCAGSSLANVFVNQHISLNIRNDNNIIRVPTDMVRKNMSFIPILKK